MRRVEVGKSDPIQILSDLLAHVDNRSGEIGINAFCDDHELETLDPKKIVERIRETYLVIQGLVERIEAQPEDTRNDTAKNALESARKVINGIEQIVRTDGLAPSDAGFDWAKVNVSDAVNSRKKEVWDSQAELMIKKWEVRISDPYTAIGKNPLEVRALPFMRTPKGNNGKWDVSGYPIDEGERDHLIAQTRSQFHRERQRYETLYGVDNRWDDLERGLEAGIGLLLDNSKKKKLDSQLFDLTGPYSVDSQSSFSLRFLLSQPAGQPSSLFRDFRVLGLGAEDVEGIINSDPLSMVKWIGCHAKLKADRDALVSSLGLSQPQIKVLDLVLAELDPNSSSATSNLQRTLTREVNSAKEIANRYKAELDRYDKASRTNEPYAEYLAFGQLYKGQPYSECTEGVRNEIDSAISSHFEFANNRFVSKFLKGFGLKSAQKKWKAAEKEIRSPNQASLEDKQFKAQEAAFNEYRDQQKSQRQQLYRRLNEMVDKKGKMWISVRLAWHKAWNRVGYMLGAVHKGCAVFGTVGYGTALLFGAGMIAVPALAPVAMGGLAIGLLGTMGYFMSKGTFNFCCEQSLKGFDLKKRQIQGRLDTVRAMVTEQVNDHNMLMERFVLIAELAMDYYNPRRSEGQKRADVMYYFGLIMAAYGRNINRDTKQHSRGDIMDKKTFSKVNRWICTGWSELGYGEIKEVLEAIANRGIPKDPDPGKINDWELPASLDGRVTLLTGDEGVQTFLRRYGKGLKSHVEGLVSNASGSNDDQLVSLHNLLAGFDDQSIQETADAEVPPGSKAPKGFRKALSRMNDVRQAAKAVFRDESEGPSDANRVNRAYPKFFSYKHAEFAQFFDFGPSEANLYGEGADKFFAFLMAANYSPQTDAYHLSLERGKKELNELFAKALETTGNAKVPGRMDQFAMKDDYALFYLAEAYEPPSSK